MTATFLTLGNFDVVPVVLVPPGNEATHRFALGHRRLVLNEKIGLVLVQLLLFFPVFLCHRATSLGSSVSESPTERFCLARGVPGSTILSVLTEYSRRV